MHKITRYGWRPDLPDIRDRYFAAMRQTVVALPGMVDLRSSCPPVVDQGQLGSCTANSIGNHHRFVQMKERLPVNFMPSRLFIYYNERAMEGTVSQDAGAAIRDGIKSIATQGVCPESMWPYDIAKFTEKPQADCYTDAVKNKAVSYQRVPQELAQMQGCLAEGYPFVIGFTVYDGFESQEVANNGVVHMPSADQQVVGGHAVMVVGYCNASQRFLVMNSWGTGWGMHGFFTIPYAYLTNSNLADDLWTIRLVA